MAKPKKELGKGEKDMVVKRVKELGISTVGETCRRLCDELGMSVNTLKTKIQDDKEWARVLEGLWEENGVSEGIRSVRRLAEVRDRDYGVSDYEGGRLIVQASGMLMSRADKVMERRSRVRGLEEEVERLQRELAIMGDEVKKGGGVGGYVLPVYVVDLGDRYWTALSEAQGMLIERARAEARGIG